MNTCYRKETIRLWIERATGKAPTTNIERGVCADIAQAMIMYNQLYLEREEREMYEVKQQEELSKLKIFKEERYE